MGIEYDYNSIMHYSATAFGGGKVTIEPIDSTKSIGNSETYTSLDVVEINALYDCPTKSGNYVFSSGSSGPVRSFVRLSFYLLLTIILNFN